MKEKSEKKAKQIEEWMNTPVQVGDHVYCRVHIQPGHPSPFSPSLYKVLSVESDGSLNVKKDDYILKVSQGDYKKTDFQIGANPFSDLPSPSMANYDIEGILHMLGLFEREYKTQFCKNEIYPEGIPELNWEPFVIDNKGERQYYQRDFCWLLEDKQLLIDSIYSHIYCGSIIVRKRSFEWCQEKAKAGEEGVAFYDVVDGKQRLNALSEFVNDKWTDAYGNYFSDLSDQAQLKFKRSQNIGFGTFDEKTTDKAIIETFLRLNQFGKPVDTAHIKGVEKINKTVGLK